MCAEARLLSSGGTDRKRRARCSAGIVVETIAQEGVQNHVLLDGQQAATSMPYRMFIKAAGTGRDGISGAGGAITKSWLGIVDHG